LDKQKACIEGRAGAQTGKGDLSPAIVKKFGGPGPRMSWRVGKAKIGSPRRPKILTHGKLKGKKGKRILGAVVEGKIIVEIPFEPDCGKQQAIESTCLHRQTRGERR